jgi:hypothetical protein
VEVLEVGDDLLAQLGVIDSRGFLGSLDPVGVEHLLRVHADLRVFVEHVRYQLLALGTTLSPYRT